MPMKLNKVKFELMLLLWQYKRVKKILWQCKQMTLTLITVKEQSALIYNTDFAFVN